MAPDDRNTALLFPTGGYQWPGMGADLDDTPSRLVLDRADAALAAVGVAPGSLRRLMAGDGQARRVQVGGSWAWTGDFPLTMAAQMALGVALADHWIDRHGPPAVVAGESMGELAAYAIAGALPFEEAVVLTYRWAADLQAASDRLGLRMAVVEDLADGEVVALPASLEASVVVAEAPQLCVVALPGDRLGALEREVERRGGHTLVSNNPCAAHEPRLAAAADIWQAHEAFLADLRYREPTLPLLGTLARGTELATPAQLQANRRDTTFQRVLWDDVVRRLPGLGVRRAVVFGPASAGYAFKKLRAAEPACRGLRLVTAATLAAVDAAR